MDQAAAGRQAALFGGLWMFIIVVSAIDGFLVWQYRQQILNTELNPWGRFLIFANGGDVWFMLAVKFIGTVVACGMLLLIRQWSIRLGLVIASAVAGLQLCLLLFLFFA
jgi:tryptophan-rich sensory protein